MSDFEDAIGALAARLKEQPAPPLEGADYTRKHHRFEMASGQRGLLAQALVRRINAMSAATNRAINLLSVGCGDGELDAMVLDACGSAISSYTGIDPNAAQIEACRKRLAGYPNVALVNAGMDDTAPDAPFDLAIAVHVVYYVEDPRAFVRRMMAATRPGGAAMIAVAPRSPMNVIADLFWGRQGLTPIFAEEVAGMLESDGAQFERERIDASIPLDLYIGDGADEDVVEFTVQADLSDLSGPARDALNAAFVAAATQGSAGRCLAHPVECFWLRKPT